MLRRRAPAARWSGGCCCAIALPSPPQTRLDHYFAMNERGSFEAHIGTRNAILGARADVEVDELGFNPRFRIYVRPYRSVSHSFVGFSDLELGHFPFASVSPTRCGVPLTPNLPPYPFLYVNSY